MLYLPRLFVYHCEAEPGSEQSETFKVMERRLLKVIINPAMIATWLLGLVAGAGAASGSRAGWLHAKFVLVLAHVRRARPARRAGSSEFAADRNRHTPEILSYYQ